MTATTRALVAGPVPVRPLDREQARLIELLLAAGGPLSFEELHDRGVENPAVLAYELEIAGVPVRHVQRFQAGRPPVPVGLELDPSWAVPPPTDGPAKGERLAAAGATAGAAASRALRHLGDAGSSGVGATGVDIRARLARVPWHESLARLEGMRRRAAHWLRTCIRAVWLAGAWIARGWADVIADHAPMLHARGERLGGALARARARIGAVAHGRHVLAIAALAALCGLTAGLLASTGGSSAKRPLRSSRQAAALHQGRSGKRVHAATSRVHQRSASDAPANADSATAVAPASAAGRGNASAARLEAEGHSLLEEGRYAVAVVKLQAAIAATGESAARCAEPSSEACLTYAYALYDLGRALQLERDPAAAVRVLGERLRIDNQRNTVAQQLAAARRQLAPARPRSGSPSAPGADRTRARERIRGGRGAGGAGQGSGSQAAGSPQAGSTGQTSPHGTGTEATNSGKSETGAAQRGGSAAGSTGTAN